MKVRLLEATLKVLMERGFRGLSVAEVVRVAGVSQGARTHHFRRKIDLVIAATEYAYEKAIERGQRIARMQRFTKQPLHGFVLDAKRVYFGRDYLIAMELLMAGRTDPLLMKKMLPIMHRYRATMNELWRAQLVRAGFSVDESKNYLELMLNLIRGMASNSVWQREPKRYRAQIKLLLSLVEEKVHGEHKVPDVHTERARVPTLVPV
jgi:AcrR family transcriptional regulator